MARRKLVGIVSRRNHSHCGLMPRYRYLIAAEARNEKQAARPRTYRITQAGAGKSGHACAQAHSARAGNRSDERRGAGNQEEKTTGTRRVRTRASFRGRGSGRSAPCAAPCTGTTAGTRTLHTHDHSRMRMVKARLCEGNDPQCRRGTRGRKTDGRRRQETKKRRMQSLEAVP